MSIKVERVYVLSLTLQYGNEMDVTGELNGRGQVKYREYV